MPPNRKGLSQNAQFFEVPLAPGEKKDFFSNPVIQAVTTGAQKLEKGAKIIPIDQHTAHKLAEKERPVLVVGGRTRLRVCFSSGDLSRHLIAIGEM